MLDRGVDPSNSDCVGSQVGSSHLLGPCPGAEKVGLKTCRRAFVTVFVGLLTRGFDGALVSNEQAMDRTSQR